MDDYLHKTSRFIIDYLIKNQIGKLIIGNNAGGKQNINLGKKTNQTFVEIPYLKLINLLKYKAELVGIEVIITEESYTSKASFFDFDDIPKYQAGIKHSFSGKRVKRGLYKSSSGKKLNADCNGSLNIIRKVVPRRF